MRVFKTKLFSRRAKEMGLDDGALFNAAREISQGSFEANLGGNIYKKRIAWAIAVKAVVQEPLWRSK